MHRDGAFVLDDETRSIFTVMGYLNEGYTGGHTLFKGHDGAKEEIKGKVGSVLIFNHDVEHEGLEVKSGSKYIFRTDIMFRRIDNAGVPASAYRNNPNYKDAMALYDTSIALQKKGDPRGSTEAYLAALEKQAQLRSVPPPVGPEVQVLPRELYAMIFRRLNLRDLLRAMQVSRGWKRLLRDNTLWREQYQMRWPTDMPFELSVHEGATKDWYLVFKRHYLTLRDWKATVVDVGHDQTKYAFIVVFVLANIGLPIKMPGITVPISRHTGHYWGAGEGLRTFQFGLEPGSDYCGGSVYDREDPLLSSMKKLLISERIFLMLQHLMWDQVFAIPYGTSPLLLTRCPCWPPHVERQLTRLLATSLRTANASLYPFYAFIDAPTLTAIEHSFARAAVVSLGHHNFYVCYVWDGTYVTSSLTVLTTVERTAKDWIIDSNALAKEILSRLEKCIEKALEADRETLWQHVILTGGRAEGLRAVITSTLTDAHPTAKIACSSEPQFDNINGGKKVLRMSTARSLFKRLHNAAINVNNKSVVVLIVTETWRREDPFVKKVRCANVRFDLDVRTFKMFVERNREQLKPAKKIVVVVLLPAPDEFGLAYVWREDRKEELRLLFLHLATEEITRSAPTIVYRTPLSSEPRTATTQAVPVPEGVCCEKDAAAAIAWLTKHVS